MTPLFRFLVIDENADSRFLLVKTLLRKFPTALLQECHDTLTATTTAQTDKLTVIVAHRTFDSDGPTLVARLREVNPTVPIVMVSGFNRSAQAVQAGANAFLNYDEWLRIGTVVSDVIGKTSGSTPPLDPNSGSVATESLAVP